MNSFTEQHEQEPRTSEYKENLEHLRNLSFFSGLTLEPIKVLAYLSRRESFKQEELLIRQGEMSERFYVILSGKVQAIRENSDKEAALLNEFTTGDVLGVLALVGGLKNLFTVKVLDSVTCLVLEREKFKKTVEQFPEITSKVFEAIIRRFVQWEEAFLEELPEGCATCEKKLGITLV
jgi:CRP/FNR family transcriptional regulator, cyclic AMP receptor protein